MREAVLCEVTLSCPFDSVFIMRDGVMHDEISVTLVC